MGHIWSGKIRSEIQSRTQMDGDTHGVSILDIRVRHTRSGKSGSDIVGQKGYRSGTYTVQGTHRVRYRSGTHVKGIRSETHGMGHSKNARLRRGLVFNHEIAALQRMHIRRNFGSGRGSRQSQGSEGLSRAR